MTMHTRMFPNPLASGAAPSGGASSSAIVRTQRALQILRLLQAGQVWSAQELAVHFNCSTRTIFRDLQLLRECGIPIDSPRGERGFKLSHDFFWQPERPTLDEMIALVVGARMVGEALPRDMAKSLDSAMAKIVGSERPAVRQRLTELNMRIDAPHLTPRPALPEVSFLPQLLEHIVSQTPLRLRMVGDVPEDSGHDVAIIPLRLHFGDGQWLLIGMPCEGGAEQPVPLAAISGIEPLVAALSREQCADLPAAHRGDETLPPAGEPFPAEGPLELGVTQ